MSRRQPDVTDSIEFDPETNTYQASFDSRFIDPSVAVIHVMAEICETELSELDPLYEAVDPDTIDQFCLNPKDGRGDGAEGMDFVYLDHEIALKREGEIEITPRSNGGGDERK